MTESYSVMNKNQGDPYPRGSLLGIRDEAVDRNRIITLSWKIESRFGGVSIL